MMIDKLKKITDERTVSSFYISIGTASILERIFDPQIEPYDKEKKIEKLDISKYKYHYYNIYTLIRNIIDALDTEKRHIIFKNITLSNKIAEVIFDTLLQELYLLKQLYENVSCNIRLFIPKYDCIKDNVEFRKESTPPNYTDLTRRIINIVAKMVINKLKDNHIPIESIYNTHLLPQDMSDVVITTHINIDLCNYTRVPKLFLLESHTGELKTRKDFSKRLKFGKNDVSNIPFTEYTLYIFGDPYLFKGKSIKTKREFIEMCKKMRYNALTSPYNVKSILSSVNDYTDIEPKPLKFKKCY